MCIVTPYQAVKRMRELTNVGLSFSFEFLSYSKKTGRCNGVKKVSKAMLRKSMRSDQSELANQLIEYTDIDNNKDRHFHLPLLIKFNNYTINP